MKMNEESSPLAGKTVKLRGNIRNPPNGHIIAGQEYRVEDYWHKVSGGVSWMDSNGNPACLMYAMRSTNLPIDNNVLYGKVSGLGHLVHVSEVEGEQ